MGYNSKAYLSEMERRIIEPDNIIMRGTHRRHKEVKTVEVLVMPDYYNLTGEQLITWQNEDAKKQDGYLKSKGVI